MKTETDSSKFFYTSSRNSDFFIFVAQPINFLMLLRFYYSALFGLSVSEIRRKAQTKAKVIFYNSAHFGPSVSDSFRWHRRKQKLSLITQLFWSVSEIRRRRRRKQKFFLCRFFLRRFFFFVAGFFFEDFFSQLEGSKKGFFQLEAKNFSKLKSTGK